MEAKLGVADRATLERIAALEGMGDATFRPAGRALLVSTYLDTADFSLSRAGMVLRRRTEPGRQEFTLKWGGRTDGVIHDRAEWNLPCSARAARALLLPEPLRARLRPWVAGRPLRPILETRIDRRRVLVVRGEGRKAAVLAEMALDEVEVGHPGYPGRNPLRYCELELEQRDGDRHDLLGLVRRLGSAFALGPSVHSKFVRGMERFHPSGRWRVVEEEPASPQEVLRTLAARVIRRQLAVLRQVEGGVRAGEAEAVHDMRVAVRRLRTLGRVLPGTLAPGAEASLRRELAWLGRELGRVRELDVKLAWVAAETTAANGSGPAAWRRYGCYLERQHRQHRRELEGSLESARCDRLWRRLENLSDPEGWGRAAGVRADEPVAKSAARALRRVLRRAERADAGPGRELSTTEWHGLRLRLKRLRYLVEFLGPLAGSAGPRIVRALVARQDRLGDWHDTVVGVGLLHRYLAAGERLPRAERAFLEAWVARQVEAANQRVAGWNRAGKPFLGEGVRRRVRRLRRGLKAALREAGR